MLLENIEDLIDKENIILVETYLEDSSGAYVNYDKLNLIIYDDSKVNNSYEKKEILAEELGHYYMDATYKFNSDLAFIDKQEYRAKKWSYNVLISYDKLCSAINSGINTIYALAEYFEVTVEYMKNAIEFYINKFGDFTQEALSY